MKASVISIVKTWVFATGVTVVSSFCVYFWLTHGSDSQRKAAAEAYAKKVAKQGTIPEYKSKNKHGAAIKEKTTTAKVVKEVKLPTYVENPIYPSFTNALARLEADLAATAQDGDVMLENGFCLTTNEGKAMFVFPDAYTNVAIGGVAMGNALEAGEFDVHRTKDEKTEKEIMDGIGLSHFKRLDEPEFYCTDVTYSMLPATRQVDSIRMHGKLDIGNTARGYAVVEEIETWMKEDYGAEVQNTTARAGTLAIRKFKIGNGMEVEVAVNWNKQRKEGENDAYIDISFATRELEAENKAERQQLGEAVDEARARTLNQTGVNYFTVRKKVNEDQVKNKVVSCGID